MAKQGGLYDKSPKLERNEKGDVAVKKPEKKEESKEEPSGPVTAHERHMAEMKDVHARQLKEYEDMYTRHQKDAGATNGSPNAGAPIKEVEKGAK